LCPLSTGANTYLLFIASKQKVNNNSTKILFQQWLLLPSVEVAH